MRDFIASTAVRSGALVLRTLRAWAQHAARRLGPPAPAPCVVFPAAPGHLRRPPPVHVLVRKLPLDGHVPAMARPYLVAYEERVRQGARA